MSENTALQEFAKWAIREGAFQAADLDGLSIQEKAHELGLIVKTTYDPEKHGPSDCADEGDEWFVFSDALSSAAVAERETAYWAVHSKTGMHIGLWPHKSDADEALRGYEGGTITALYLDPPPTSELEAEIARLRERVAELEKAMFSVQVLAVSSAACWHQKELENVLTKIEQVARRVREGGKTDG